MRPWSTSCIAPTARQVEYAGGSAANAAVALSRLDRPVLLATAFTDDHYGADAADHLSAAGVRLAGDPAAIGHTSSAVATLGRRRRGVVRLRPRVAAQPARPAPALDPVVVHTSSLGAVLAPGADDGRGPAGPAAPDRPSSATTSTRGRASPAPAPTCVAAVHRIAGLADVVKASDEDLEALYPERTARRRGPRTCSRWGPRWSW